MHALFSDTAAVAATAAGLHVELLGSLRDLITAAKVESSGRTRKLTHIIPVQLQKNTYVPEAASRSFTNLLYIPGIEHETYSELGTQHIPSVFGTRYQTIYIRM